MSKADARAPAEDEAVYTRPEAARLLGMASQVISRWMELDAGAGPSEARGSGRGARREPTGRDARRRRGMIGFESLVELFVVERLHDAGVSLPRIRRVVEQAGTLLETKQPFNTKDVTRLTAMEALEQAAAHGWTELFTCQKPMQEASEALLESMDFGEDGRVCLWWPFGREAGVVVDPNRGFGELILHASGVPVRTLAWALEAGDPPERIAEWYGITPEEVESARHVLQDGGS